MRVQEHWVSYQPRPAVQHAVLPGGMVQTPINLDPEEGDSGNPIDLDEEEGTSDNPISL